MVREKLDAIFMPLVVVLAVGIDLGVLHPLHCLREEIAQD